MEDKKLRLSDVNNGESCLIVKVNGYGGFRHRIMEMGFIKGKNVTVVKNAPFQDPIEYNLLGSHISLRRSEAELIEVVRIDENGDKNMDNFATTTTDNDWHHIVQTQSKIINVALVGNPNSGKTSLFNRATGQHEKVGNYGGVTIDAKAGVFKHKGYTINLIDLPGTYSITEYTPEELFVRKYISESHPDIVLNVLDTSNLERNMYLTTQLIDMNVRIVACLNMYDELKRNGAELDYQQLGEMMGIPFVPTTASKGIGIEQLLDTIIAVFEDKEGFSYHIHINYGRIIEDAIRKIKLIINENKEIVDNFSRRYLAIKLLENDKTTFEMFEKAPNFDRLRNCVEKEIADIEKEYKEDTHDVITNLKYGFIRGALKETLKEDVKEKHRLSNAIDEVLTHKYLGFPFLLVFLWVMFQATFTIGSYPMDWIDAGFSATGGWLQSVMADGWFKDLLVDGIVAGVGGVVIFLPNILILFFFISLMEDTGYMARTAFIMDKLMHKIGLHGKSFIPMLMGFGCNVPAVMATRTLENRKDRILTMLIIPFMSCSARLPVYVLLVSAFFPKNQGLVLMSIYIVGIIVAIMVALLMKNTLFAKKSQPFVMELPPYRMPTMRNTIIHMWNKSAQYLQKMGTVILLAAILIWALCYFPKTTDNTAKFQAQKEQVAADTSLDEIQQQAALAHLDVLQQSDQMENSYIGRIGHTIAPVLKPMGFDWKMGVSIVTGLAAK